MRHLLQLTYMGCFLVVLSFLTPHSTYACVGVSDLGAFPLYHMLRQDESSLVMGYVNTVSESGINAVVTVGHYLRKPQADGVLLINRERLEVINAVKKDRLYPRQCANLSRSIEGGRQFIGILTRAENGTYSGHLLTADEKGVFHIHFPDKPNVYHEFDYNALKDYVEQQLQTTAEIPPRYVYPRAVEVHLFTEHNQTYLLPVDATIPTVKEPSFEDCSIFLPSPCGTRITAPNGFDSVVFHPVGSGLEGASSNFNWIYVNLVALEADTAVFSKQSDLLAAWTGNYLRLLYLDAPNVNDGFYRLSPSQLAAYTPPPDDPLIIGAGAWSPDQRTFAFSTRSGVWVWQSQFPDLPPTLFLAASDEPIRVRHYSPLGTYLALETDSERYHINIFSKEKYPDGMFSADETMLAAYDTGASGLTPLMLYDVTEFPPEPRWHDVDIQITQFEWITETEALYAACGDPIRNAELEGFDQPWCKIMSRRSSFFGDLFDGIGFDYETVTESLGILVDEDTIMINREQIELSGLVDDKITRLELKPVIDLNYWQVNDLELRPFTP